MKKGIPVKVNGVLGLPIVNRNIADTYRGHQESIQYGIKAQTMANRLADILKSKGISVLGEYFQWAEERSPNHHPYSHQKIWPVILIRSEDPPENSNLVLPGYRSDEINTYGFTIETIANSFGGILENSIDAYKYSLSFNDEERQSYEEACKKLEEEFGKDDYFMHLRENVADFIRLEGFDQISKSVVFLEFGEVPEIEKIPGKRKIKKKNIIPPFIPQEAVEVEFVNSLAK